MAVYGFNQLDNTASYTPDEYESVIRSESYWGNLTVEMFNQLYITAGLRNIWRKQEAPLVSKIQRCMGIYQA